MVFESVRPLLFAALASALATTSLRADAELPPIPPVPYSIPWQLRGLPAVTAARSDTSIASYENNASDHGLTVASIIAGSIRIPETGPRTAGLALTARTAVVEDSAPGGRSGFALVNPQLGAIYAFKWTGGYRLTFALAGTIPVGMGGGGSPSQGPLQARLAGPPARLMMDNSLFGTNDFTIAPGVDFGWVENRWTLQAEATLFQSFRVRGAATTPEPVKTNSTFGLHVGYFIVPNLSVGAELRYQHWINAPLSVDNDPTGRSVDTVSMALGPRAHFDLGGVWLRPGLAYARPLDRPLAGATPNYHIVQVDIPFVF
jgi:hypothetical protein